MIVLGLKGSGHDTGAAILWEEAGELKFVAISEERLNRSKHSLQYPLMSIDYCLKAAGLKTLSEVDVVAFDRHNGSIERLAGHLTPYPWSDHRPSFNYAVHKSLNLGSAKPVYIHHLLAHAASTAFLSGFDDAGVLVVDAGLGLFELHAMELTTHLLMGYGPTIERSKVTERPMARGPGMLFNAVTEHLGFGTFGAGKTMALASFGALYERADLLPVPANRHRDLHIDYTPTMAHLARHIERFDKSQCFKGSEGVLDLRWVNLARQTQELLEQDMLFLARTAIDTARSRNLCLAGGVALSCVTNRRIYDAGVCDGMFIQPASSDEGIPLGCALAGYYLSGGKLRTTMQHAYLGTPNASNRLANVLQQSGLTFQRTDNKAIARLIAEGKIIGRVAGGAEYGPRALGNRSILADPRRPYMADVLNRRVKHRELFRPFAPSCHADKAHRYFDMSVEGPFMIVAAPVKPEARSLVPAIVHVDGSCRPQTVRPDQNPSYYDLIEEFGRITGIYCLINTSFNDNSEPIVETYEDALASFLQTGLDHLYIENYLVDRPTEASVSARILARHHLPAIQRRYDDLAEKYCNFDAVIELRNELERRATAPGPLPEVA